MDIKNERLDSYFANVSARRRSVANWRIYAAVTGSAMAMATDASAGVIYFDQVVTAGPLANAVKSDNTMQSQNIALKSVNGGNIGFGLKVGVFQTFSTGGSRFGDAFIDYASSDANVSVLADAANGKLKKLAFGAHISTLRGIEWGKGQVVLGSQTTSANVPHVRGWAANATGLAIFRFSTTNHTEDYGWVRLSYTLGTDGLANSITAKDWAYESTGAPITAGETASSGTPEPSTTALAILAAGAAGVAALRRRRQASGGSE